MTRNDFAVLAAGVAVFLLLVAVIVFGVYSWVFAPCDSWWFDFQKVGELPGRCL